MSNDYRFNPSTGEFENKTNWKSNNDRRIGLWGIAFLLFPLVGFIVYFFIRNRKPSKAQSILYWSIAGVVLFIVGMFNQ